MFASPLIYVLVAAAILSVAIREWSDAGFIAAVPLINAIIGTVQEYSAQRAAALRDLVTTQSRVIRDGDSFEIEAEELVPGDIVMLESGDRISAGMRLLSCHDLAVDESLLTGESLAVWKTVALAIGMRRMARHNVIVRRLVAVESLGSCTYICVGWVSLAMNPGK